jgi:ATP-dependent DNA helicase RecG
MSMILPFNVESLVYLRGVESERVEFKASWGAPAAGWQVIKTVCAFANDLHNLNGGYIIIGVDAPDGIAVMPPRGMREDELEDAQNWIRGQCNRIEPVFQPVISPEQIDGKNILVVWAPGSNGRPHRAPDGEKGEKKYWVRLGASTVDAQANGVLGQLMELTAKTPFDCRRALNARTEDMREAKAREFLRDIGSALIDEPSAREMYRKMRVAEPVNGHDAPLNVGLLMFSDAPDQWFPGARIEFARFVSGPGGDVIEEKLFAGAVHEQLRGCLSFLENLSTAWIEKKENSIYAGGQVDYPHIALREALVNAVCHRGYDRDCPDPVKVYLYSDRIEITSYPGPVRGLERKHLAPDGRIPALPARNRRIGEFFKELRLAEMKNTGLRRILKAMRENGSPDPEFDFDDTRTYFTVTLPVHPEFAAAAALRDAAQLRAAGRPEAALVVLEEACRAHPDSFAVARELARIYTADGRADKAKSVLAAANSIPEKKQVRD